MIESMLPWFSVVGQLWWIPVLLWVLFFFWSRFVAYPIYLERKIRAGKQWIYLPKDWTGRRLWVKIVSVLWLLAATILSTATLYWLLPLGAAACALYLAVSLVFGVCLLLGFAKGPYSLQRDYYYQIYRALEEAAYKEGRVMRPNDLRKADKENRLTAFLKGKANL
jgi:hypothetical protein